MNDDMLSLIQLKNTARKLLPQSSTLRNLILSEPDHLPRQEASIKTAIFLRLLDQELSPTANLR